MRYIGIYEHMRKTLKTWDVKSMEDLKFETLVITAVLSLGDEVCHRDIIAVLETTTDLLISADNTRTFSTGVLLKLLLQSFQGKRTQLLHANDCRVLVGF